MKTGLRKNKASKKRRQKKQVNQLTSNDSIEPAGAELYPADIERGEFGFPIGSKFNDISYLSTLMTCIMCPKSHILLLYRMMKDVHDLFKEHDVPYFVDGGTLLGAIRHEGVIPWDDDVDIGILPKSEKQVYEIIDKLKPLGYGVQKEGSIMKVFIGNKWIQSPVKYSANPTLDIFVYCRAGDFIQLKDPGLYSMWPSAKYSVKELFPLKLYKFGSFQVYGANDGSKYCDRIYPKWKDIGVVELRCSPQVDMSVSKEKKIKLPMKLLNIFTPRYNVVADDIASVQVNNDRLYPKCIKV